MGSMNNFMSKFGGCGECDPVEAPDLISTGAPNALGTFLERFSTLTESYWFYDHTEELRYDTEAHAYFRVDPELGNLIELYGVTNVLKIIDKSAALVPWSAKMVVEKLLRLIPLATTRDEFGSLMLAPLTLEDFTKIAMDAKTAPRDKLEDAGDIGHLAHACLEVSIQYAIDHNRGVVLELRDVPTDEKAKACAEAGLAWMQAHNVRWIKTEQKIYSKEFGYAGTMDGKALVDSCDDPVCCTEKFNNSLSIIDWKSSNDLHAEYILQAAGAYCHAEVEEYGEDIQNCFILRLGKNAEEAGKFAPWRIPAKDFPRAFQGFLLCLQLVALVDEVKAWISTQAKGVREAKKKQKAEQKEIAKMQAKVEAAAAKAQKKLDRAVERERIKAEAKKNREEAKLVAKKTKDVGRPEPDNEVPRQTEDTEHRAVTLVETMVVAENYPSEDQVLPATEAIPSISERSPTDNFEEDQVERKPLVVPEEG